MKTNGNAGAPMLLQVTLRRFGNSRKADMTEIQTEADKGMLRLGKRLIDCPEYQAVNSHDMRTMSTIRARSIPALFKHGIYQIRPTYAERVDAYLKVRSAERTNLVRALCAVYDAAIEDARQRLGPQFDATNYPTPERFRATFGITWRFFTMTAPENVEGLASEFIEREKARLSDMFAQARAEGIAIVRAEFQGLVEHLLDRLTPGEDGEKKRLNKAAIEKMTAFLDDFPFKDVGGDEEIKGLLTKTRQILDGVEAKDIRKQEGLRNAVRGAFEGFKAEIDALVEKAPRRFIELDALED
jgi:hypothetical protein